MAGVVWRLARLPVPAIAGAAEMTALLTQSEPLFAEFAEQRLQQFAHIDGQLPGGFAVVVGKCLRLPDKRLQYGLRGRPRQLERLRLVEIHDGVIASLGFLLVRVVFLSGVAAEIENA